MQPIPVIDLFAGPGGLAEGFSRLRHEDGGPVFDVKLSVEKDSYAHRTLTTRAFYRQFESAPDEYYQYLEEAISREELFKSFPDEARRAETEAMLAELGKPDDDLEIEQRIRSALADAESWVLIGGPPCQAYSMAGRSRRSNEDRESFERDPRHTLYLEYLKIIAKHSPSIFVMENVKGMLSSKLDGHPVIERVVRDLASPREALGDGESTLRYRIHSLAVSSANDLFGKLEPADFVLRSENHGVPQRRHRVILLGIREDTGLTPPPPLEFVPGPALESVLTDLPRLRSQLGARWGDDHRWKEEIEAVIEEAAEEVSDLELKKRLLWTLGHLDHTLPSTDKTPSAELTGPLDWWYRDDRLGVILNHEARSHMVDDLARYFYSAVFAGHMNRPARIDEFPERLIPAHRNARAANVFVDRFKVQMWDSPSSTITSHISRDGHYFIHPDATMVRSLTVREAARLQTFPDNYLFEGPRTQQYHQVGNAVPPYLAYQIAERVSECLLLRKEESR